MDAVDGEPSHESSLQLSRELRVILVATLEERLASESEVAVLTALANTDTLRTTVRSSDVRCALVSYRQEKHEGADDRVFGNLTLDGAALRGIVAAAHSLGVDAIWLDAWCYRAPAGVYDHEDFCKTLSDVIEGVESVVRQHPSPTHALSPAPTTPRCRFGCRARSKAAPRSTRTVRAGSRTVPL